ncbi:MAG: metallophosphoesterase [bacterium]
MKLKLNWIIVSIFVIAYFLSISKPLFSMKQEISSDTKSEEYSSDTEIDVYSYIDTLNDALLQSMKIEDWVNRPMLSKDFLYLTNKFINNITNTYKHTTWLCDKCVDDPEFIDTELENILEWHSSNKVSLPYPKFPCIAKLILPQNTRVAFIGDIHGDMDTVEGIFYSLRNENFIDEFMKVKDDARIIFLGDYTDRGDFNLQTLSSALILAVKNPEKVFLLKGNHESNIDEDCEIIDEIKKIEKNKIAVDILICNAIKACELMPVGMFLGFKHQRQTPFYFLAHGGPDIRYDYSDFLNLNMDENLCFWMLTSDDLLKTRTTRALFEKIYSIIKTNTEICNSLESHDHESLDCGFLWNDVIDFACRIPVLNNPQRGKSCISLNAGFIKYFLESFTNENVKIVGLIRGHQHHLAKKIGTISDSKILSPSCSYFTSNPTQWRLLAADVPTILNNTFSIVTVISGPIQEGAKIIQYSPTFLALRFLENGTHTIEAIEHAYN